MSSSRQCAWPDDRLVLRPRRLGRHDDHICSARAEGSDTLLSFAHRGFEQANEGYARVRTGWGYFLESLQMYLKSGKGTPR